MTFAFKGAPRLAAGRFISVKIFQQTTHNKYSDST